MTTRVACAASASRSTATTCPPSRAYSAAAALPLLQPMPNDPAPRTRTVLPSKRNPMRSVQRDVGELRHALPKRNVGLDGFGELGWRVADDPRTQFLELGFHLETIGRLHRTGRP